MRILLLILLLSLCFACAPKDRQSSTGTGATGGEGGTNPLTSSSPIDPDCDPSTESCTEPSGPCAPGEFLETAELCSPCPDGSFSPGGSSQYCTTWAPLCAEGESEIRAPSSQNDRICERCIVGSSCGTGWEKLATGTDHSCAIAFDDSIRCVGGTNVFGAGNSSMVKNELLIAEALAGDIPVEIAVGQIHACAITSQGDIRCWGSDQAGELSPPEGKYSQIQIRGRLSCALSSKGSIDCWGEGAGAVPYRAQEGFAQYSLGHGLCTLDASGKVACWAADYDGSDPAKNTLKAPAQLPQAMQIAVGYGWACSLSTTGTVNCWGVNFGGTTDLPMDLGVVTQIAAGYDHACAVINTGKVRCWGGKQQGLLIGSLDVPPAVSTAVAISSGNVTYSCALEEDGKVSCWGADQSGRKAFPAYP